MKKRSRRRLQIDPSFNRAVTSSSLLSATSRVPTAQPTALRSRTSSVAHSDSELQPSVCRGSLALVLPRPDSPAGTVFEAEDEEMKSALASIGEALQGVELAVSEGKRRRSLEERDYGDVKIARELLVLGNSNDGRAESRGKRRTFVKAFIAPSKDRENRQPLPRSKSIRSSNSPSTARMPPLHPRSCRQPSPSLPRH